MNNPAGTLVNQGTLSATNIVLASGFALENRGTISLATLNINGVVSVHNAAGATLTITASFAPSSGTLLANDGTFTVGSGANLNGGTTSSTLVSSTSPARSTSTAPSATAARSGPRRS
jgi:hypothetical protein